MLPFPNPPYLFDSSFSGQFEVSQLPPKLISSSPFLPFSPPSSEAFPSYDQLLQLHPVTGAPADPSPEREMATAAPRGKAARKRVMRKDRHSKIHTAQGARDRRMRLSLEVARKFFDLQDLLGFDKPSKTVQWLLTNSKSAIKDLVSSSRSSRPQPFSGSANSLKSESSTLECDDVSTAAATAACEPNRTPKVSKKTGGRASRKPEVQSALVRESRAKARARARERTREKEIRMQCGLLESDASPEKLQVSSSIPFDAIEEESISHDPKSSLELAAAEVELCSSSPNHCMGPLNGRVLESFLMAVGPAEPPITMFDYQLNNVSSNDTANTIQEQWELQFPGNTEGERVLLTNTQLHAKPWEVYNYPNF